MNRELVCRSAEHGISGLRSIQSAINISLQMLDAYSHSKSFTLHTDAMVVKEFKDISCGMPGGEHDVCYRDGFSFDVTVSFGVLNSDGLYLSVFECKVNKTRAKRYVSSGGFNHTYEIGYNGWQHIASDVWLCVP